MAEERQITIAGIFPQSINVDNSLVNGDDCKAEKYSHAEGFHSTANGNYSHAEGVSSVANHERSYVWSGINPDIPTDSRPSSGIGTFNIFTNSAADGLSGIYVNGKTLTRQISSTFNPHFSNKVLTESNNAFAGDSGFSSNVAITGSLTLEGGNGQSSFEGVVTAETVLTSYDAIPNRLATIEYVRNMLSHRTAINEDRYVHVVDNHGVIGEGDNPIYVNKDGFATASVSSVGSNEQPAYLYGGIATALSGTAGTSSKPIYSSEGLIRPCEREIPDFSSFPRIVATYSATGEMPAGSDAPMVVRDWYRLYSDGWCEQGGTVPFNNSGTVRVEEKVPYLNDGYCVQHSIWDTVNTVENDIMTCSVNQQIDRFVITADTPVNGANPGHILRYGGINWLAKGQVSENTKSHILNGDSWNHVTASWNSELILTTEKEGSTTMTLTAGQYRLFMVGRGGHTYNNIVGKHADCLDGYSGGAGATFILDFEINADTVLTFGITGSECILYQTVGSSSNPTNTALVRVGFGQDTTGGKVNSSNISMATFNYSIIGSYDGGASNLYQAWRQWDGQNGYILPIVKSEYYILYSRYNGCSSTAQYWSRPGALSEIVAPGNPLIELYRKIF